MFVVLGVFGAVLCAREASNIFTVATKIDTTGYHIASLLFGASGLHTGWILGGKHPICVFCKERTAFAAFASGRPTSNFLFKTKRPRTEESTVLPVTLVWLWCCTEREMILKMLGRGHSMHGTQSSRRWRLVRLYQADSSITSMLNKHKVYLTQESTKETRSRSTLSSCPAWLRILVVTEPLLRVRSLISSFNGKRPLLAIIQ